MTTKGKNHQFNDCPPVQHKRDAGFAEVFAPVNIHSVDSPHINTGPGNAGVVDKVQKVMYPTYGQGTTDGPNLYESTTGRKG
jgi:hypothetical protein